MGGLHLALLFGSIQLPPPCVPETLQFTCGPATRVASLSPDGLFACRLPRDASRVVTASGLARCGLGGEQYIFTATGRPALLTVPLSLEAGAREWAIKIAAVYPYPLTEPHKNGPPFRCDFAGCLPMTQNKSIARVPASLPSGCPFSERTVRALIISTYIIAAAAAAALALLARRHRAQQVIAATDVPPAAWPAQASTPRARRGSPPFAAGGSASSVGAASTVTLTPPIHSRRRVNFDDSGRRYLVSSIGGAASAVEVTAGRSDRVQQALDHIIAGAPARGDHYMVVAGVCAPHVAVARLDE